MPDQKKPADKAQDLKKIEADKAEQVKGGQLGIGQTKFKY